MSLVSKQQLDQNQLQMKQLDEQRQRQAEQTRSFQSNRSSTQELLQRLRSDERKKQEAKKLPSDPLSVQIPISANPTEVLANRFNIWRSIIGALIHYFKETVSVHEEVNRQQIRLNHAIAFPFVTQGPDGELYQPMRVTGVTPSNGAGSMFSAHPLPDTSDLARQNDDFELARKFFVPLGSGSVQDLPTILYQYHSSAASLAQGVVKELDTGVIPRLEDLRQDLQVKIKEIRSLQSDFKNSVGRYLQETKVSLKNYQQSIEVAKRNPDSLAPKNDPYLLKYTLDRQIKKQLTEENYLHEAFINIQTSGKELDKVVYIEIQTALTVYAKLMGQQAQNVFDGLISRLDSGILTKDPAFEWSSFVSKDSKDFIDLNTPMRHLSEIRYKYQSDPLNFEIRSGFLERKSKYLKSYARGWYVLTPCFIHEFKSPDRKKDPLPLMSIPLNECQTAEHSRKDERNPGGYHKFVLHTGQSSGILHKGHNWVFRVDGYDDMMLWYNDLKRLTQMPTPQARSTISWDRHRSQVASATASTAASLASASIRSAVSRNISLSIADQSSSRHLAPARRSSIASNSIDTILTSPQPAPTTLPAVTVNGQTPSSVDNTGVIPVDVVGLKKGSKPDSDHAPVSSPDDTKESCVDSAVSEKVGELDVVSTGPTKETQM